MSQVTDHHRTVRVPSDPASAFGRAFEQEIAELIAEQPQQLRLDCSALTHVVSSHVNLLWKANARCREAAIGLRLVNPPISLMRVLYVLDLTHLFTFEGIEVDNFHRPDQSIQATTFPKTHAERVKIDTARIDMAIGRFVSFLNSLGADATTILELRTIFYEIATNIRIHSGLGSDDEFTVEVTAQSEQLEMTIADSGRAFDPTATTVRWSAADAARNHQLRGFGLLMVSKLADRVRYTRDTTDRNVLTVRKKWRR
ncbi:MAG: ATP-binding protein [Candidatus Zixiibacteriota bacterium]